MALGLVSDSVETASNLPMFLILLPFLELGLRADRVDAGPAPLVRGAPAVHADHRDAARAAARDAIGDSGVVAVAWCLVISLAGYLWARRLYERLPARAAQ